MSSGKEAVAGSRLIPELTGKTTTRLIGLFAALAAVVLLALGGPSLMGALTAMRAETVLAGASRGLQPAPDQLEKIVESSYAGSVWHGDNRVWMVMGDARLAAARQERDDEARQRRLLDRAVFAYERGLSMGPANSLGWMRLGEALMLRTGPSPRAARALEESVKTGSVAPEFGVERLTLLLAMWDLYDQAGHAMIADQARIAQRNGKTAPALAALLATPEGARLAGLVAPSAGKPHN